MIVLKKPIYLGSIDYPLRAIQILVESPENNEIFQKHMTTLFLSRPVSQTCSSSWASCVGRSQSAPESMGDMNGVGSDPTGVGDPKHCQAYWRGIYGQCCVGTWASTLYWHCLEAHMCSAAGLLPVTGPGLPGNGNSTRPGQVSALPRPRRFYFTFKLLGVEKWGCCRQFLYRFR